MLYILLNVISKVSLFILITSLIYMVLYLIIKFITYILKRKLTRKTEIAILILSSIITFSQFTFYNIY